MTARPPQPSVHPKPKVIGIAGGIGSGKSEVAGILAELGCIVSDSDAEGRRALERDDVRAALVGWWGKGVLDPAGRIDRSRVASVVFADPSQRRRLEALVHPIIHTAREHAFAANPRAPACVIDAPLLFEAGLDKLCDAVLFVDTPRQQRLDRLRSTRGWDEQELARREAAQIPLEEKRKRCAYCLMNQGERADLKRQVQSALAAILAGNSA